METQHAHPVLRSGEFSIEKRHYENVGLKERFLSVFAGAWLLRNAWKHPFKSKFLPALYLTYRGFSGHCLLYEYLGIDASKPQAVNIRGEFIIDRPAPELYAYWRNLKNLPGSLGYLMDVEVVDELKSRWKSRLLGQLLPLDWEAEIVKDEPGHLIGWRASSGALLQHVGKVEFHPTADGKSTILRMVLSYHPVGGGVGIGLARLLNPYLEQLLTREIRNFKHPYVQG